MWLSYLAYSLPPWALVLLAFAPATLAALALRPYARRADQPESAGTLQTTVFAMTSTAFVFFATFSANTMWNQVQDVSSTWRAFVQSGTTLERTVAVQAPAGNAAVAALLDNAAAMEGVVASELPLNGPEVVWTSYATARQATLDSLTPNTGSASDAWANFEAKRSVEATFANFETSALAYLRSLDPGLPDIVYFAVILLAMMVVGMIVVYPPHKPTRFSSTMVFLAVMLVGILQLPLWILNSQGFILVATDTEGFGQEVSRSVTGQLGALVTFVVVLVGLFVLLTWRARRTPEAATSEEDASTPA